LLLLKVSRPTCLSYFDSQASCELLPLGQGDKCRDLLLTSLQREFFG
jgi:hypothetical protein